MLGLGQRGPEHGEFGTSLLQTHASLIHIQLRDKIRLVTPAGDRIGIGLGSKVS